MKVKTVYEIGYTELEELVQTTYSLEEWSFVADQELGNDSAQTFNVVKEELDTYEKTRLAEFLASKGTKGWMAPTLMQDLANQGVLPPGDYVVKVCW